MTKPEDRFWAKVSKSDGCWEWTAGLRHGGYGSFYVAIDGLGRNVAAHRYSYEMHHGPIPEGAEIMHSCDNPRCVNPAHLSAGTHAQNMQDMGAKRRNTLVGHSRKTHCPKGHEYTSENTYLDYRGHRRCKECTKLSELLRYHQARPNSDLRSKSAALIARSRKEA